MMDPTETLKSGPSQLASPPRHQETVALTRLTYVRVAMAVTALLLPTLSLVALGSFWLWQNGYLVLWAAISAGVSALIYALEWLVVRGADPVSSADRAIEEVDDTYSDAANSSSAQNALPAREQDAWDAVEELIDGIRGRDLSSRDAAISLARRTVEVVAGKIHPGEKHASLKFTLPEALSLVERVSSRLNHFVQNRIPLGDRITVGQAMGLYRWRGLIGVAEKAYDLWRIVRIANPASAAAGEMRDKLSGELLRTARSQILKRIARAYVHEIAAASIDLYSGRLKPADPAEQPAV